MKKFILLCLTGSSLMASTVVFAQEKAPLGNGNFALKLGYIGFTDSHFDPGAESDGIYIGLEGYGMVAPNWYLGGEIDIAANLNMFSGEFIDDFVPIELNLKFAKEAVHNVVVDFGAGLSCSSAETHHHPIVGTAEERRDDWLFGGQIFVDLTYRIDWFSIGINGKYQITEEFKDEGFDLSNYRLGMQLGLVF